MAAITITGTLTRATVTQINDPDYLRMQKYRPNSERYLHFLDCCLEADGKRYFFKSPKVR